MDQITRTDGLSHIAETIFMNLNGKNLEIKCMEVNPFWAELLSNPQFWLKKCLQKEKKNLRLGSRMNGWLEVIQTLKSEKLKKRATLFLQEILKRNWQNWTIADCSPLGISYEYNAWNFFGYVLKTLSESERNKSLIERIKRVCLFSINVHWRSENDYYTNYNKLKALLLFMKDTNLNDLNAPEFAEKNPQEKFFGWSPIQKAAYLNHSKLVEILIPYTVDPNAPTPIEWTPLQIAASNGFSEIVKLLAPLTNSANAIIPATPDNVSRKFDLPCPLH